MSDPPTLHRDLTSKNILLDRFLRAKIAGTTFVIVALTPLDSRLFVSPVRSTVQHTDFGLSRFKEENGVFTQGCGALAFMVRSSGLQTHAPPMRPACLVDDVHMMLTQDPGARGLPRGSLQRKGGRLLLRHRTMTISITCRVSTLL
jgi:serine/threonine protein kinase